MIDKICPCFGSYSHYTCKMVLKERYSLSSSEEDEDEDEEENEVETVDGVGCSVLFDYEDSEASYLETPPPKKVTIILGGKCPLLHKNNHPDKGNLKYQSYMEISRILRPKINTKVYWS